MKQYTFKIIINEINDEFWEGKPTAEEVGYFLIEAIENCGFSNKDTMVILENSREIPEDRWN